MVKKLDQWELQKKSNNVLINNLLNGDYSEHDFMKNSQNSRLFNRDK